MKLTPEERWALAARVRMGEVLSGTHYTGSWRNMYGGGLHPREQVVVLGVKTALLWEAVTPHMDNGKEYTPQIDALVLAWLEEGL